MIVFLALIVFFSFLAKLKARLAFQGVACLAAMVPDARCAFAWCRCVLSALRRRAYWGGLGWRVEWAMSGAHLC